MSDAVVPKATNPKDSVAGTRLSYHLVPSTLPAYAALAYTEGALKYGAYNWRVAPVRGSVYMSGIMRHLAKYWNGEWADQKTKVPHLASVLAGVGIILDAGVAKTLIDDRPPAIEMANFLDECEEIVGHLQELFKDYSPKQWTMIDLQEAAGLPASPVAAVASPGTDV